MGKEFSRTDRISRAIQRELSVILLREVRDPRLKWISVSEVKVSRDLSHAKIYVSSLNHEVSGDQMAKILNEAQGYFSQALAKTLGLRVIPQLNFIYDPRLSWITLSTPNQDDAS